MATDLFPGREDIGQHDFLHGPLSSWALGAATTRALALAAGAPLPVDEVAPQRLTPAAPRADS